MNDRKIIIVEDEDKIAQILVDYLAKDGLIVGTSCRRPTAVKYSLKGLGISKGR